DPDATIFYTLDGSVPDPGNLQGTVYRYKNSYAQPPQMPTDTFLEASYETIRYTGPIPIRDRSDVPDRLAHISTTFDLHPAYFPQPLADDSALNFLIYQGNRAINQI